MLITIITPMQLAGLVEISLQNHAAQLGAVRSASKLLDGLVFMESGGRWLIALLAAALTIYATDGLCAYGSTRKPPR